MCDKTLDKKNKTIIIIKACQQHRSLSLSLTIRTYWLTLLVSSLDIIQYPYTANECKFFADLPTLVCSRVVVYGRTLFMSTYLLLQ